MNVALIFTPLHRPRGNFTQKDYNNGVLPSQSLYREATNANVNPVLKLWDSHTQLLSNSDEHKLHYRSKAWRTNKKHCCNRSRCGAKAHKSIRPLRKLNTVSAFTVWAIMSVACGVPANHASDHSHVYWLCVLIAEILHYDTAEFVNLCCRSQIPQTDVRTMLLAV